VECLRCALHDRPPPDNIDNVNWGTLLRQARGHSVECFLFPWFCKYFPGQFSARTTVTSNSPQAAWRAIAIEHLDATLIRQKQTSAILAAAAKAGIEVLPLKGTWLSETIYQEASQRQMVDIDLLVKKADRDRSNQTLIRLGYAPRRALSDSEYMCDLSYYHSAYSIFVELHWNVECQMGGATEIPDIEKILMRTDSSTLFQHPVKTFKMEDQLCHLVQHILHHQFALSLKSYRGMHFTGLTTTSCMLMIVNCPPKAQYMETSPLKGIPLKSYIDIALLINAKKQNITREQLDNSAIDWKTGEAVPFILQMVTCLLDLKDIPKELIENTADQSTLQDAVAAIFELPLASTRNHEINLLKYRESSMAGKLRIIFNRIFMPKSFMQLHYPFAKNILLLPITWLIRTISLIRSSGKEIVSTKSSGTNLINAANRAEIIKKLTEKW